MSLLEKRVAGLTVRIDRDSCIGTGACVKAAPELFVLDDRQVVTFVPTPDAEPEIDPERVRDACAACPVFALEAVES